MFYSISRGSGRGITLIDPVTLTFNLLTSNKSVTTTCTIHLQSSVMICWVVFVLECTHTSTHTHAHTHTEPLNAILTPATTLACRAGLSERGALGQGRCGGPLASLPLLIPFSPFPPLSLCLIPLFFHHPLPFSLPLSSCLALRSSPLLSRLPHPLVQWVISQNVQSKACCSQSW